MPRMCAVCGKTYTKTIKRSHSMQSSIKRLQPNLQWARIDDVKLKACTKCIKTQTKEARS